MHAYVTFWSILLNWEYAHAKLNDPYTHTQGHSHRTRKQIYIYIYLSMYVYIKEWRNFWTCASCHLVKVEALKEMRLLRDKMKKQVGQ